MGWEPISALVFWHESGKIPLVALRHFIFFSTVILLDRGVEVTMQCLFSVNSGIVFAFTGVFEQSYDSLSKM